MTRPGLARSTGLLRARDLLGAFERLEVMIAFAALEGDVVVAATEWRQRRDKQSSPTERCDGARRFRPDADEWEVCCANIRPPSRAHSYSSWAHCHRAAHVAVKFGVDGNALHRMAKMMDRLTEPRAADGDVA